MKKTNDAGMFVELSNDEASRVQGGGYFGDLADGFMYLLEFKWRAQVFTTGCELDRKILENQDRASKVPGRQ